MTPGPGPERRDGAVIHDLPDVAGTEAYLVEPESGVGSGAGVLFLHWFDSEAPDGNRTQFVDEAVELAREHGVVSVLPQGRFPWFTPPTGSAADRAEIAAELARNRAALELLAARRDVEDGRIGLVGHDFGGMHGTLLAAEDARVGALVLIASTPRWGDWFLPFWPIQEDRFDYLRALSPVDPIARIGAVAPRPVYLQFARNDFYIAAMTGLELKRAASEAAVLEAYDADHACRDPAARAARTEFLRSALTLG